MGILLCNFNYFFKIVVFSNVGVGNLCLFMLLINISTIICILIFIYLENSPMHSLCENIHKMYVYVFTQRMHTCIFCAKTYTQCVCFYTKNAVLMRSSYENIHTNVCMFSYKECINTSTRPY